MSPLRVTIKDNACWVIGNIVLKSTSRGLNKCVPKLTFPSTLDDTPETHVQES